MEITRGIIPKAQKVVLYGPEGIGKSTFAAQFPEVVFIDTEGSTAGMDVARLPEPKSWPMLLEEVRYIRDTPGACQSLAIDTADWAEKLAIQYICDKSQKSGIEDWGYGKGYTYLAEAFGELLRLLQEVVDRGVHVVITAHAKITKFEQPDEMGAYDRWELKLTRQVSPMVKEWADMVLFANYKTFSVMTEEKKRKAQGGKRVLYTTHNPCWDGKNRHGLPDELPFEFASIGKALKGNVPEPAPAPNPPEKKIQQAVKEIEKMVEEEPPAAAASAPPPEQDFDAAGLPDALVQLMRENEVTPYEIQLAVSQRGYFPIDMPVREYPEDFIQGVLIGAWKDVFSMILCNRDLPFD